MSKVWRNFAIDAVLFAQAIALAGTGSIMRWVLPPGSGRRGGWGEGWEQGPRALLGLTRHEWGSVHFWIAASLLAVLALHLVVHWRWIVCRLRDLRPSRRPAPAACDDDAA